MNSEKLSAFFIATKLRELEREKVDPVQTVEAIVKLMKALYLIEDIELYFKISTSTGVGFESKNRKGQAVLEELRILLELPPCPEGACEYDSHGNCRWCGSESKA